MADDTIADVHAWQALDSRGRPTVGVTVTTSAGHVGRVVVPSGASTGSHEAVELRDRESAYAGWGVRGAVRNVNDVIGPALTGKRVRDQVAIDTVLEELDGTPNLARLGANAVLAVSIATYVCAAESARMPLYAYVDEEAGDLLLPRPMFNIVSGGAHAGRLIDIQDVLAVPLAAETFDEALEVGCRVRAGTAAAFDARKLESNLVADEGGLAGRLAGNRDALDLVVEGIERSGLTPGVDVGIALDIAATQFHGGTTYTLRAEGRALSTAELVAELRDWCEGYPIVSIEDPLAEDDWEGWVQASRTLGEGRQLLGDDLFATNLQRLQRGVELAAGNAVLVKPNQAGTITRTRAVIRYARAHGYATVLSARSGDTEDCWLADLAVGWRTGQIKVGSTMRSERTAKWNRLLEIESRAGGRSRLAAPPVVRRVT